jgi:hypothetical protein
MCRGAEQGGELCAFGLGGWDFGLAILGRVEGLEAVFLLGAADGFADGGVLGGEGAAAGGGVLGGEMRRGGMVRGGDVQDVVDLGEPFTGSVEEHGCIVLAWWLAASGVGRSWEMSVVKV